MNQVIGRRQIESINPRCARFEVAGSFASHAYAQATLEDFYSSVSLGCDGNLNSSDCQPGSSTNAQTYEGHIVALESEQIQVMA
jgi:hypothetical protein